MCQKYVFKKAYYNFKKGFNEIIGLILQWVSPSLFCT